MNVILVIGFIYMIVHLFMFSFKKGENLAFNREEFLYPMIKSPWVDKNKAKLFENKVKFLSKFTKKHKLMYVEIQKSYKEPFSVEFVSLMAADGNADDTIELIARIFEIKESKEYASYVFQDDFHLSRYTQFWEVKKDINQKRMDSIVKVSFERFSKGLMSGNEQETWLSYFTQLGLIEQKTQQAEIVDREQKTTQVPSIGNLETELPVVEEVVLRDVSKKRAARFDSAKQNNKK